MWCGMAGSGELGTMWVSRMQKGFVLLCVVIVVVLVSRGARPGQVARQQTLPPLKPMGNDGGGEREQSPQSPVKLVGNNDGRMKLILLWTKWYGRLWPEIPSDEGVLECPEYNVSCRVSYHKENYERSDLVVFHGRGSGFNINSLPNQSKRPPHQRWLYFNEEAPPHSLLDPQFNGLFNWSMTFLTDSEFHLSYAEIQPGRNDTNVFDPNKDYLAGRDKMALAVISNCYKPRLDYVRGLQKYISVDLFGRCGKRSINNFDIFPNYKFYLSFENCLCKDYVTEKFYRNSLMMQLVPVTINLANLSNVHVAPPGSYINALDFKGAKELADYMTTVASNSTLYNSFFKWHSHYIVHPVLKKDLFCDACHKLYTGTATHVYDDFYSWYGTDANCVPYLNFTSVGL